MPRQPVHSPLSAMYPLTTTTARIDACNPCGGRRSRAAQLLGITEPSNEPISYAHLLDTLGLDDALWCCQAEPDLSPIWRRYAVWCARQVQYLMADQRSLDALDVAERHADGQASDQELAAAWAAAWDAARAVARAAARESAWAAARDAAWDAARAAAWESARAAAWESARQQQTVAFRQLVTTGTLP